MLTFMENWVHFRISLAYTNYTRTLLEMLITLHLQHAPNLIQHIYVFFLKHDGWHYTKYVA